MSKEEIPLVFDLPQSTIDRIKTREGLDKKLAGLALAQKWVEEQDGPEAAESFGLFVDDRVDALARREEELFGIRTETHDTSIDTDKNEGESVLSSPVIDAEQAIQDVHNSNDRLEKIRKNLQERQETPRLMGPDGQAMTPADIAEHNQAVSAGALDRSGR